MSSVKRKLISLMTILTLVIGLLGMMTVSSSAANKNTYKIVVNKKYCTTTVYKKVNGKYKPIRVMLCSVGKEKHKYNTTTAGTWRLKKKHRWYHIINPKYDINCWAQYMSVINGKYSFHSPSYDAQKLSMCRNWYMLSMGKKATHSCIRLYTIDCKWIYENCPTGTKVTVLKTSNKSLSSLGKGKKVYYTRTKGHYWEPTDPTKSNPYYTLKPAKFTFSKSITQEKAAKVYKKGSSKYKQKYVEHIVPYMQKTITLDQAANYKLTSGVKAKNPNCKQNISSEIVAYYKSGSKWIKATHHPFTKAGDYKLKYYIRDKYCAQDGRKGEYAYMTLHVVQDQIDITQSVKMPESINAGESISLFDGIKAKKQISGKSCTSAVTATIKKDGSDNPATTLKYKKGEMYTFTEAGTYKITYHVDVSDKKNTCNDLEVTISVLAPQPVEPETPADGQTTDQPAEQPANPS